MGAGPFRFVSWGRGESLKVVRNEQYWQKAPDGKPYPYLNAIDFQPVASSDERLAALVKGDLNMIHTSAVSDLAENIPNLEDDGVVDALVSDDFTETAYLMLNVSGPPFDRREARIAFAQAMDRERVNDEANKGFATLAKGPFAPEVLGYLEDPGTPSFDLEAAKKGVAAMEAADLRTRFSLLTSSGPAAIRTAGIQKDMLEKAGFTIDLEVESEAGLIERVIAGTYELAAFRNQPGEDPDANYNWWYGKGNPVNFGGWDDPELNDLLDAGRSEPDPAKRKAIYQDVNRRMATQVFGMWAWFTPWAVVTAPEVHNIFGPPLPGEDPSQPGEATTDDPARQPNQGLATAHSLLGLWIEQ